ncbi:MAG TPA: ABC transporter substrate-binding protein [Stellaceae bacterium]|jgi:ABC-type nitrate/sulfonate/bicarbonate transport system substrate-binding protein|nr:ABC transporter substrate-binding protein [Stellaceae bacterium]
MKAVSFRYCVRASICLLALAAAVPSARAASPTPLTIVIFSPPSLGAVLPGVIKQQKFDQADGLDITFAERTPDAYAAQFNSGEFQLGGSAAVLTLGLADTRGVKVAYLFNLFDYWGAVVTQDPAIKSVADLRGKQMAAAKGTTNYAMFEWLAKQQGLDPSSVKVLNTATAGLVGYALANRADAVQLWEPAYTLLMEKKPDLRTLDLHITAQWQKFAGGTHIPYLGVAAHRDWIHQHEDLAAKLYHTYRAAGDWVAAHPTEAAPLIAPKASPADLKAIANLIKNNRRLGMNVEPAGKLENEIKAVYRAGRSLNYLPSEPSADSIYKGAMN